MKCGHISNGDSIFRSCIFPLFFNNKKAVFDTRRMFALHDEGNNTFLTSVSWERLVPSTNFLHSFGCRLAQRMNDNLRTEGKFNEQKRRVYCGAYEMKADAVRGLANMAEIPEVLLADVMHHPENGEIAHADLKIVLKPDTSDVEGTKTAIVDRLWANCSGPIKHICHNDNDIDASKHPNIHLQNAPLGTYADTRSCLQYFFDLARLYVCQFVTDILAFIGKMIDRRFSDKTSK